MLIFLKNLIKGAKVRKNEQVFSKRAQSWFLKFLLSIFV